ncbi:hypothetical protein AXX12_14585 [Anaerosporomusa subterranea]|uniref:Glyoxalase/fosfomycin resistance/dioxygenase domain-containing protein n=1 Tax=Anaerosporomusa subterranea TaxID=1794912 RepID=A0A154BN08_ANASB|nr:VOC family protein [Anaerosporomusa subterranea]KYZ75373.1 hypothetical protein AXX12_14585 [Anaerosporomusa subterranea]
MKLSYANLYVTDVQRSVSFYEKAFGLTLRFIHESGHYAEMETGTTTLVFCQHELAKSLHPARYEKSLPDKTPLRIQELSGSISLISTRKHKACEVFTSQAFCFCTVKVQYLGLVQ